MLSPPCLLPSQVKERELVFINPSCLIVSGSAPSAVQNALVQLRAVTALSATVPREACRVTEGTQPVPPLLPPLPLFSGMSFPFPS